MIESVRSQYPGGRIPPDQALPRVPPELRALQAQRNEIIESSIAQLAATLEPERFKLLDDFVEGKIRPKVLWQPVPPIVPPK